ncbi:alpha/beta fold hydrolase [Ancylobacter dichloromethanicus]
MVEYEYTFDHLAATTARFLEQLELTKYSLYIQDYGAPVGFRIMMAHPERLQALVVQKWQRLP